MIKIPTLDADPNIGLAVGALQGRLSPGVYVAMSGRVLPSDKVERATLG